MLHLHSFTARKGCVILEMEVLVVPPAYPLLGGEESSQASSGETEAPEVTPEDSPWAHLLPPDLPTLLSTMEVQGMLDPTRDTVVSIQVRCGVVRCEVWWRCGGVKCGGGVARASIIPLREGEGDQCQRGSMLEGFNVRGRGINVRWPSVHQIHIAYVPSYLRRMQLPSIILRLPYPADGALFMLWNARQPRGTFQVRP